jgi:hypothetical protein
MECLLDRGQTGGPVLGLDWVSEFSRNLRAAFGLRAPDENDEADGASWTVPQHVQEPCLAALRKGSEEKLDLDQAVPIPRELRSTIDRKR